MLAFLFIIKLPSVIAVQQYQQYYTAKLLDVSNQFCIRTYLPVRNLMIFCSSRERNLKTPKPIKMRTDLLDFFKFKSKLYSNIILTKLLSLSIYVFVVVLLNFN